MVYETFVCVVDSKGKKICEKSLDTDPKAISMFLHGLNLDIELVGLESGSLSHWLTEQLQEMKMPAKCIDARHIAALLSVNVNKTDRNDARGIANALRCGMYKEVRVKKKAELASCTLLNTRQ